MRKKSLEQIHYEKYKPINKIYISVMVICAVVRFIPVSSGSVMLDDVFNDFAVGACASTWAAWLLDMAQCSIRNKDREEKEQMVYSEYINSIHRLTDYISIATTRLNVDNGSRSLKEWLFVIYDLENYKYDCPQKERSIIYEKMSIPVRNIKQAILRLQDNYSLLVFSDIIDTNDMQQHLEFQINNCNSLEMLLNKKEFSDDDIRTINDNIDNLVSSFGVFFPDYFEKSFSWDDAKG